MNIGINLKINKMKNMNRERKFRAWDGCKMLSSDEIGRFCIDDLSNEFWISVMEYSNKKDKNGNFICEGDVLKCNDIEWCERIFIVKWDEEYGGLLPLHTTNDEYDEIIYDYSKIEIIGNIYENPNLVNIIT